MTQIRNLCSGKFVEFVRMFSLLLNRCLNNRINLQIPVHVHVTITCIIQA